METTNMENVSPRDRLPVQDLGDEAAYPEQKPADAGQVESRDNVQADLAAGEPGNGPTVAEPRDTPAAEATRGQVVDEVKKENDERRKTNGEERANKGLQPTNYGQRTTDNGLQTTGDDSAAEGGKEIIRIGDLAQTPETQTGGTGSNEPPIESGSVRDDDFLDPKIPGTGKTELTNKVVQELASTSLPFIPIEIPERPDRNWEIIMLDESGRDAAQWSRQGDAASWSPAEAESRDSKSGSGDGREEDSPATGDEEHVPEDGDPGGNADGGEGPADRDPGDGTDGGDSGGGPTDGSDEPEAGDGSDDNRREIAEMRKVEFIEVAHRIDQMSRPELIEHTDEVDQSLVYVAKSFGRIARAQAAAEAASGEPVPVTEGINRSEMEQYLLPMALHSPEAAIITYYTGARQGDAVFSEKYAEMMNKEWLDAARKLAENPGYLPTEDDHRLLSAIVHEFGEWVGTEPEGYHTGQEEIDLMQLIVGSSAPHGGIRWQVFVEYYDHMAKKGGESEPYYKSLLNGTLEQLLDTREPRQLSDEFVSEVTFDAIRYTDNNELRHLLASNYLVLVDRMRHPQEYTPDRVMLLAGEIFRDVEIPDADRDKFIDAIKNDTDIEHIQGWGRLNSHTQLLIRMNHAAATRLGAARPDAQASVSTSERDADFDKRHHELKFRIMAHAGASMVSISNELGMHNSQWSRFEPIFAGFATIDSDDLFHKIAIDQARTGHYLGALGAASMMSEERMDETFVACWNLAKRVEDMQILLPAAMTPDMRFRHLTAQIIKTEHPMLVARRGEILTMRMLDNFRLAELLTQPGEQQTTGEQPTILYDVSRLGDEQYRNASIDWMQLNAAVETLAKEKHPEAQDLAEYVVRTLLDNNIEYTNRQMEPFYNALTANPDPRDLRPSALKFVHRAINASSDNDATKTRFLAKFAYDISR